MENKENTTLPPVAINSRRGTYWVLTAPFVLLSFLVGCGKSSTDAISDNDGNNDPIENVVYLTPPDDPIFLQRWYLLNLQQTIGDNIQGTAHADIRALEAWEISRGENVVVAVLDAGVASAHPNLKDRLVPGWDFVDDDPNPEDLRAKSVRSDVAELFHGTAVADAVLSIAPEARIMPLRVIGMGSIFDRDIAAAVRFARDNGADIINLSLGTFVPGFGYPETAVAIAESPGVLVVAGAGNDGNDANFTRPEPCSLDLPNVLCVAATDENDHLATFFHTAGSNFGSETVHMAAPGTNFLVAQPTIKSIYNDEFSPTSSWVPTQTEGWKISSENGLEGSASLEYTRQENMTYPREVSIRMTSPVSFENEEGCYLDFWYWSNLEGSFLLNLESSSDGSNFILRAGTQGFSFVGQTKGEWKQAYVPLNFEMSNGEAYFGFYLRDGGGSPGHVRIDNVNVSCNDDQYESIVDEYGYAEGTSFATPLTAGVAALVKARYPELTPAQLKWAVILGGQPLPSLAQTTIAGTRLDAHGALTFPLLFENPPDPFPKFASTNTNSSGFTSSGSVELSSLEREPNIGGQKMGELLKHLRLLENAIRDLIDILNRKFPDGIPARFETTVQIVFQTINVQIATSEWEILIEQWENNMAPIIVDLFYDGGGGNGGSGGGGVIQNLTEASRHYPDKEEVCGDVDIICDNGDCSTFFTEEDEEKSLPEAPRTPSGDLIALQMNEAGVLHGSMTIPTCITGTNGRQQPGPCPDICYNFFYR